MSETVKKREKEKDSAALFGAPSIVLAVQPGGGGPQPEQVFLQQAMVSGVDLW